MGNFDVTQRTKDSFFNATELIKQWNKTNESDKRIKDFIKLSQTSEFIDELQKEVESQRDFSPNGNYQVVNTIKGRNTKHGKTADVVWYHPYLFIKFAMWLNPRFEVKVIKFVYDQLIAFRNDSGDSYKEMSAAIWQRFPNKKEFPEYIIQVANYVRKSCGVDDWEKATEEQLRLRDKIHDSIKTLTNVLTNTDQAVQLGVKENVTHKKEENEKNK